MGRFPSGQCSLAARAGIETNLTSGKSAARAFAASSAARQASAARRDGAPPPASAECQQNDHPPAPPRGLVHLPRPVRPGDGDQVPVPPLPAAGAAAPPGDLLHLAEPRSPVLFEELVIRRAAILGLVPGGRGHGGYGRGRGRGARLPPPRPLPRLGRQPFRLGRRRALPHHGLLEGDDPPPDEGVVELGRAGGISIGRFVERVARRVTVRHAACGRGGGSDCERVCPPDAGSVCIMC